MKVSEGSAIFGVSKMEVLKPGDAVKARWSGDGHIYDGTVVAVNKKGLYEIIFYDGVIEKNVDPENVFQATSVNAPGVSDLPEAALHTVTHNVQKTSFKRKRKDVEQIEAAFQARASRSELTAAFREEVLRFALEVVPGGRGRGGTRGSGEAAQKYRVSQRTVHHWLQAQRIGFVRAGKRDMTDAFKKEVVQYALEIVPGGNGKGGTRGSYEAARNYGVQQSTVQRWLKAQEPGFVKVSKSDITDAFKEQAVRYALEVVPGGNGKGGTRGILLAAHKFGVSEHAVRSWFKAQSGFVKVSKSEITNTFKKKVVQYALEVVPGARGKGGTRGTHEAARKYGVSQQAVQTWLKAQESGFVKVSKSEITDAFKKKVVQYALEEVPRGNGKGGTRGACEAARKYGVSPRTVQAWVQAQESGFVRVSKSEITDAFKKKVVQYALEVVAGGNGKGGTRGTCKAAQKYGVEQSTVHGWLKAQESGFVRVNKSEITDAFKQEVVQYALEVVPGGNAKGGTRGPCEAATVYGISPNSVYRWIGSCRQCSGASLSNTLKSEVVRYVLDTAVATENELMAITSASKKYSVEPAIIKGWIRHSQRPQNNSTGEHSKAKIHTPAAGKIEEQGKVFVTKKAKKSLAGLPENATCTESMAVRKAVQQGAVITKQEEGYDLFELLLNEEPASWDMKENAPKSKVNGASKKRGVLVNSVLQVPSLSTPAISDKPNSAELSSLQRNTPESKKNAENKKIKVPVPTVLHAPSLSTPATSDKPDSTEHSSPQENAPKSKVNGASKKRGVPVNSVLQVPSLSTPAISDKLNSAELSSLQDCLHMRKKVKHLKEALQKQTQQSSTISKKMRLLQRNSHNVETPDSNEERIQNKKKSCRPTKKAEPCNHPLPKLKSQLQFKKNKAKKRQRPTTGKRKKALSNLAWLYKIECCVDSLQ